MLLTAFESAMIHTLCTPPPPNPPKIAAYVIVGEGRGGGLGVKTIVFESREFFEILSYGFMLCCQIMYEAQCTC